MKPIKTKWYIDIDTQANSKGLEWAKKFFSLYNTSEVEWVRIAVGRSRNTGVYGFCYYPERRKKRGYRLSCHIPGPFPSSVRSRCQPIYRNPDGTWPVIPEGEILGPYNSNIAKDIHWNSPLKITTLENSNEGIVWVFAHEMYHFLRNSRQLEGRNVEWQADKFADEQLKLFKRGS